MANIVSKLNLNKTPRLVEDYSLIFAKNIKYCKDGSIGPDNRISNIELPDRYDGYKIVGVIPYNTKFYLFLYKNENSDEYSTILEYDELQEEHFNEIKSAWKYSGGVIEGQCSVNIAGDILLSIAEHKDDKLIPLKTINIAMCTSEDDESIYTQAPSIPIINLSLCDYYTASIPHGVYMFFIRYEISKDNYTKWLPASREIFAGYKTSIPTIFGRLLYNDINNYSANSFVFNVNKILDNNSDYTRFQVGFLLSYNQEMKARAWKHFDINTEKIYFSLKDEEIEKLEPEDLLDSIYNIFNVKNIVNFKNKLYISNYVESDFNIDDDVLKNYAKSINIELHYNNSANGYYKGTFDNEIVSMNNVYYINTIIYDKNRYPNIPEEYYDDYSESKLDIEDIIRFMFIDKISDDIYKLYNGDVNNIDKTYDVNKIKIVVKGNKEEGYTRQYYKDNNNIFISYGSYNQKEFEKHLNDYPGWDGYTYISGGDYIYPYYGDIDLNDETSIKGSLKSIFDGPELTNIYKYINTLDEKLNIVDENYANPLEFRLHLIGKELPQNDYEIVTVTVSIDIEGTISKGNSYTLNNNTLLIGQAYKFYLHYVTKYGEITNGYEINEDELFISKRDDIRNDNIPTIYPTFTFTGSLPSGYSSCFISIMHTKNKSLQLFGFTTGFGRHCIELDTALESGFDNLNILGSNTKGKYYGSFSTESNKYFGKAGYVYLDNNNNNLEFITLPYTANEDTEPLKRCTPFIVPSNNYTYDKQEDLDLYGYKCVVSKPIRNHNIGGDSISSDILYFASGQEIYKWDTSDYENLTEEEVIMSNLDTNEFYTILSNYNLDMLSFKTDPITVYKTEKSELHTPKIRYIMNVLNSTTLSSIYELSSEYFNYTRKTYLKFDPTIPVLTTFTNTVRSSELDNDESRFSLVKFNSLDYYNIPRNKGIIVKLAAVGEVILVHTEDSIFRFSGANTLTAQGGEEIALKEGNVFDTGIAELFGSEYGYGGLQNRNHSITTFFGYLFYDKISNKIYLYGGNSQLETISDAIDKLLKYDEISDLNMGYDVLDDRIFISIKFANTKSLTLSYNLITKSFASLHDFYIDKAFNTRDNIYFIEPVNNENNIDYKLRILSKSAQDIGLLDGYMIHENPLYPSYSRRLSLSTYIMDSVIDIIVKDDIESVKTLNSVSWVVAKILNFAYNASNDSIDESIMAEEYQDKDYAGRLIFIYTDLCASSHISLTEKSYQKDITDVDYYRRVRYNQGIWTFNYFRDIKNINDIFNYLSPEEKDTDESYKDIYPQNFDSQFSDNHSNIEGRYFIIRFVLHGDYYFKFENLILNYNKKL